MKTIRKFLIVLIITIPFVGFTQTDKFGVVRTDGFEKITPRAYWSQRPEAKEVFNNWKEGMPLPEGVDEIVILKATTLLRFYKNENNGWDINYIAVPEGEKVYRVGSMWYFARCGNRVEFWDSEFNKPKETIVEKDKFIDEKKISKLNTQQEIEAGPITWIPPNNLKQAVLDMSTTSTIVPSPVKKPWLFKSIPNWLEPPLIALATYGLYKAGDFAWYHWIKTPKPLPATIWMDPTLDPAKAIPGSIQTRKSFTFTLSF